MSEDSSDMFGRFTDRAREVMALANQEARRFNHEFVGTEHILLGLVKEGSGVGANILKNLGVELEGACLEVEKLVKNGPDVVAPGKLPETPLAKKVIEYALEEMRSLNHNYVGTEHLLLGLLRAKDGIAAQLLRKMDLELMEVREEILNLLGCSLEIEEARTMTHSTEGGDLNGKRMARMMGPGVVDQQIRGTIQTCWMAMPEDKKTVNHVESEIRRLMERALKDLREDSDTYGIGEVE